MGDTYPSTAAGGIVLCRRNGMMNMRGFLHIYGKTVIGIAGMIILSVGLMTIIWLGWGNGAVMSGWSASAEKSGEDETQSIGEPVLYAKSLRVLQGQRLLLSSVATAKDVNGDNLDSAICFTDQDGKTLTQNFDTSEPGCYSLTVSVCSRKTGRKVRKTVTILVDGRCV
jgi:hypothetical protein